jgi:hypothetical protein
MSLFSFLIDPLAIGVFYLLIAIILITTNSITIYLMNDEQNEKIKEEHSTVFKLSVLNLIVAIFVAVIGIGLIGFRYTDVGKNIDAFNILL